MTRIIRSEIKNKYFKTLENHHEPAKCKHLTPAKANFQLGQSGHEVMMQMRVTEGWGDSVRWVATARLTQHACCLPTSEIPRLKPTMGGWDQEEENLERVLAP